MIPILLYHRVIDIPKKDDPLGLTVPPAQFEKQMRYLASSAFRCLTLKEVVGCIRNGTPIPAKSFALTFDDGFQDVYLNARPILEKFGFTASVFLVAGCMGSVSNWWGEGEAHSGKLLSWDEARDLARQGYELGSHTLSHPRLTLLDNQSVHEEIRTSRILLQEQLDMEIAFFSYPYSNSDVRVEQHVEAAGYRAALAVDCGVWSVYNLWRVPCLRYDTALSFALKVSGLYNMKTALRVSAQWRFLRSGVRMARRALSKSNRRR